VRKLFQIKFKYAINFNFSCLFFLIFILNLFFLSKEKSLARSDPPDKVRRERKSERT
jgi:hypothetical protein